MADAVPFGRKLRRAMIRWNWSADALARASGTNRRTVESIILEEHNPKPVTVRVITEAIENDANYRICDCCRGTGKLPIGTLTHRWTTWASARGKVDAHHYVDEPEGHPGTD